MLPRRLGFGGCVVGRNAWACLTFIGRVLPFLPLRTTLAEAPIVRGSIGYAPGRGKSAGRNGWTVKE